jgi:hypothetical protein
VSPALCPRCQTRAIETSNGYCRPCRNEYRRQYYRANHESAKRRVRTDAWKRQGINITWDEYETLLADQQGVCAICHQPPGQKALHVDHDHNTGQVRALLCTGCNTAIGSAQEDPDLLRSMADYIETHQPKPPSYLVRLGSFD